MDDSLRESYGAYEVPDEVYRLFDLERELNSMDLTLDSIGFQPCFHNFSYSITPPDLIPFAHTGGDGTHFGFLTDFGEAPNLMEAPIVCVSPTNDPPIRYMAQNLHEFLDLVSSVPHADILESIWTNPEEKHIQKVIAEFSEYDTAEWKEKCERIFECFREKFHTSQVDIGPYLQGALKKRADSISISTLDGLGIIGRDEIRMSSNQYPFDMNKLIDKEDFEKVDDYVKGLSRAEKLAFIRDANYLVVLTPDYREKFFSYIVELMQSLDLHDEVERMNR